MCILATAEGATRQRSEKILKMIVSLNGDIYSLRAKKHETTPKNTKKQQPTDNQKITKYKNVS